MNAALGGTDQRNALFDRLVSRETDPYTEADRLVDELLNGSD